MFPLARNSRGGLSFPPVNDYDKIMFFLIDGKSRRFQAVFLFLLFGFFVSCTAGKPVSGKAAVELSPSAWAEPPMAILQPGAYPLWFELAEDGPGLIDTPGEAGLSPFAPWPLARHISSVLQRKDGLAAAVNGGGFLRFEAGRDGETGLYYDAVDYWAPYTVGAFFLFEGRPAALLYRDDFFAESVSPLPSPRLWALRGIASPEPAVISALEEFPPEEGWDVDALNLSPDGYWYYRGILKSGSRPEIAYRKTRDLSQRGAAVSITEFQNSALPEPLSSAPALLRPVLESIFASGNSTGGAGTALVVSPDFSGPRRFSSGNEAEYEALVFYREGRAADAEGAAENAMVFAALPGGRGIYAENGETFRPFDLPSLPEGFVYTGVGLAGDAVFAAWEEQRDWNIGASGFMVVKIGE
jgi:hypothetical protein